MAINQIRKMLRIVLTIAVLVLLPAASSVAAWRGLIEGGWFAQARSAIAADLAKTGNAETQQALKFELERMRRIELDFPHSESEIRRRLLAILPGARDEEIARWSQDGTLENIVIDGQRRYFHRAAKNAFYIEPMLLSRKSPDLQLPADSSLYKAQPLHRTWLDQVPVGQTRSLAPIRLRIQHSITVQADAVPAGETLRVWIPFPRSIPGRQQGLKLISSTPARAVLAPASALQRTAYLEARAVAGKPTEFTIEYELYSQTIATRIDPDQVTGLRGADVQPYLSEQAPHIIFTPALRAYSRAVIGDETHPYRVAQRLFRAVASKPWAVAREYSTIYNLSQHALGSAHADCGEKTMLLIALMRLNGIPARWQSGWQFSPEGTFDSMHDWGQFYLAPYGWLPMDPTHGVLADTDPAVQWFYLGGIDAYRVAFNDDWGKAFTPEKKFPRSESVDSQRGEVEWRGGNLYFDTWDYRLQWRQVK
jgi:transglutaminase-like putative cysteine protease